MEKFDLEALISSAGDDMGRQLKRRLLNHPGELGRSREEIIKEFLRSYLPSAFGVDGGFVFDINGTLSQQIDIIIFDAEICPIFRIPGGVRIFPCECVYAVGQVKSSLTTEKKLQDALDNIESVKSLDRSCGGTALDYKTGLPIDQLSNHLDQIFGFIFICGRSLSSERIVSNVIDRCRTHGPETWTNIIFSLDQHIITFCCDYGICPNPMDALGVAHSKYKDDKNILMKFYLQIARAIQVTSSSLVEYSKYMPSAMNWNAKVIHSTWSSPPPKLSALL